MNDLVELWERPASADYMIVGWHQWADAGEVSSGLPQYLIEHTEARKIGEIKPADFYLFQIPGTHHLLRPVVKLEDGHRVHLEERQNEFYLASGDAKGLLIFLGEEPHQNEEAYSQAFLDAVEELGVKRVVAVAGVHGPVPYDKRREISCVYSLPALKDELLRYALKLSNYEGGSTIGTYLADRAEPRNIEFIALYALAPAYDFSRGSMIVQQMSMQEDFRAWQDIMVRLNHMFRLDLDLSDLQRRADEVTAAWDAKIDQLESVSELDVQDYLAEVRADFTERRFEPLSHIWEDALGQLFDDAES
jgi:proteasome assembly chaperone (PAC2) family protein